MLLSNGRPASALLFFIHSTNIYREYIIKLNGHSSPCLNGWHPIFTEEQTQVRRLNQYCSTTEWQTQELNPGPCHPEKSEGAGSRRNMRHRMTTAGELARDSGI
jgi:hypothetical protein